MYFGYGSGDGIYIILLLVVMGISMYAQSKVQRTFNQFSQTYVTSGLRAEEIAQQLLNRAGSSVQIQPVQGSLTDHYDPRSGIVGLSTQVYGQSSARDRPRDAVSGRVCADSPQKRDLTRRQHRLLCRALDRHPRALYGQL